MYLRRRLSILALLVCLIAVAAYALVEVSSSTGQTTATGRPTFSTQPGHPTTDPAPATTGTGVRFAQSTTSAAPRSTTTRGAPPRPAAFPIGTTSLDVTAQTPAGPARVPVAMYYPALAVGADAAPDRGHGPYPLIVFSQGFGQYPSSYSVLIDAWARAGFVVAAPTYTHTDPGPGLWRPDIVNHPAELSATITAVLDDSASKGDLLSDLVDPALVAAAGQSDGGDVSLAASANTCCRDTRIKAAVILSGAEYSVFGGSYFTDGSPPMLVTQGNRDSAVLGNAPVCSTNLYNAAPPPKYYVDLLGATHLPPYTEANAWEAVVAKVSVDFLDAFLLGRRDLVPQMLHDGNVAGVSTITANPTVPSAGGSC